MKKLFTLLIVAIILCASVIPAFADAASYPMEQVDYYVIVATPDGGLNLRAGPGVEYSTVIDYRIPDGVELHITLESDNWGYTKYNGEYGWVALKQTTYNGDGGNTTTTEDTIDNVDYYVYVATPDGGLNLREGPSINYDKVISGRIPDGVKLHITGEKNGWGLTEYQNKSGWISLNQTSSTKPDVIVDVSTQESQQTAAETEYSAETTEITETFAEPEQTQQQLPQQSQSNTSLITLCILIAVIVVLVVLVAVLVIVIVNKKK